MRAGQCQTFLTLPQSLSTVCYIQLWVRGIGQLGVLDSAGAASGGAEVMNTGGMGPRTASMEEDLSSSAERSLQCSLRVLCCRPAYCCVVCICFLWQDPSDPTPFTDHSSFSGTSLIALFRLCDKLTLWLLRISFGCASRCLRGSRYAFSKSSLNNLNQ